MTTNVMLFQLLLLCWYKAFWLPARVWYLLVSVKHVGLVLSKRIWTYKAGGWFLQFYIFRLGLFETTLGKWLLISSDFLQTEEVIFNIHQFVTILGNQSYVVELYNLLVMIDIKLLASLDYWFLISDGCFQKSSVIGLSAALQPIMALLLCIDC